MSVFIRGFRFNALVYEVEGGFYNLLIDGLKFGLNYGLYLI